jgi:putative transcriptional regulator
VRAFESVAGTMLGDNEHVDMRPDALNAALKSISDLPSGPAARSDTSSAASDAPLSLYPVVPWRWVGRGVWWRPVAIQNEAGESRALMLKAMPGVCIPGHRHSDAEWTCVLEGAFRHEHGRFAAGDFDEADESVEHHPRIEEGAPCVCLVALSGRVEFNGWIGRLLQPLVRF